MTNCIFMHLPPPAINECLILGVSLSKLHFINILNKIQLINNISCNYIVPDLPIPPSSLLKHYLTPRTKLEINFKNNKDKLHTDSTASYTSTMTLTIISQLQNLYSADISAFHI